MLRNSQITTVYQPFIDLDSIKYKKDQNGNQQARKYFPTNNVMLKPQTQKGGGTIYLPAFLRLKFKNFNDMDIGGLSALLNGEIILVIYYGELFKVFGDREDQQIQKCLMQQVVLLFARDDAIKLNNNKEENEDKQWDIKACHDKEKHQVKFVVNRIFKLYLDSQVFFTPFQVINGILEITVQPIKLLYPNQKGDKKQSWKQWKLQFNLQNHWNIQQKVSFANWGTFGNYDLAEKRIGALYTNYRISQAKDFRMTVDQRSQNQEKKNAKAQMQANSQQIIREIQNLSKDNQAFKRHDFEKTMNNQDSEGHNFEKTMNKQEHQGYDLQKTINKQGQSQKDLLIISVGQKQAKIQAFHYAYFNIPLYKFPLSAIITIFTPLFFLDVLNFGILFQDNNLSDRIAAIATLVLAFAALIPTIRSQIPPNPKITLVEILVYLQTLPTLLAIIQSLDVYDLFPPGSTQTFVYDWASNAYFWIAFCISVITFLIILVLVVLHYCIWYPEYNDVAHKSKKPQFNRNEWRNTECNRYFYKYFVQEKDNKDKPTAVILKQKKYISQYKIDKKDVKKIKKLLKKEEMVQEMARKNGNY